MDWPWFNSMSCFPRPGVSWKIQLSFHTRMVLDLLHLNRDQIECNTQRTFNSQNLRIFIATSSRGPKLHVKVVLRGWEILKLNGRWYLGKSFVIFHSLSLSSVQCHVWLPEGNPSSPQAFCIVVAFVWYHESAYDKVQNASCREAGHKLANP